MSKKSMSKLFDSKKLNEIKQIVGGQANGTKSLGTDTTNTVTYDTQTEPFKSSFDGTNTGFKDTPKGERDNPKTDLATSTSNEVYFSSSSFSMV